MNQPRQFSEREHYQLEAERWRESRNLPHGYVIFLDGNPIAWGEGPELSVRFAAPVVLAHTVQDVALLVKQEGQTCHRLLIELV